MLAARRSLLHGGRLLEYSFSRGQTACAVPAPATSQRRLITQAGKFSQGDLVELIAAKHTLTKTMAKKVVDTVLDTITAEVAAGRDVTFSGFGTFKARERKARTGRNPRTGEPLDIPAKKVPAFSAGKAFKGVVENPAAAPAAAAAAEEAPKAAATK